MRFSFLKAITLFILISYSFTVNAQNPCIEVTPITEQVNADEEVYDPLDCGLTNTLGPLPPISGLNTNDDRIFETNNNTGGIAASDIYNDYSSMVNYEYEENGESIQGQVANPFTPEAIIGIGSYVDQNVDIAALIDCYPLDCLFFDEDNESNLPFAVDINAVITHMLAGSSESEIQNFFLNNSENPDPSINYHNVLDNFNDSNNAVQDEIDLVLGNLDFDQMFEDYYGLDGVDETSCSDLQSRGQKNGFRISPPPTSGEEDEYDLDLFSSTLQGIEGLGSDKSMPSPDAMQIINQVQSGVDLYNGLPSTSVPLHNYSSNDIYIPVSLSYNGGGIPVDAMGTDVGTSWGVNAGGAITRVVYGLPDDYKGETIGGGIGPVSTLKPSVILSGGGVFSSLVPVPHKSFEWNPLRPHELKYYISLTPFVVPIVPLLAINLYIYPTLEITVELNVAHKPDHLTFKEKGIGYLYLTDPASMSEFDLNTFRLSNFDSESEASKLDYFKAIMGNKFLDDASFISPKVAQVLSYVEGIDNLFGDAVKRYKKMDSQPDEFYFSIGSYSGKFVFDDSGNIHAIPHQELKIEKYTTSNTGQIYKFEVTTPEGLVYTFGGTDFEGVDFTENVHYSLPNNFTYPVHSGGLQTTYYGKAGVDQISLPYKSAIMGLPRAYKYGSTYENNYKVSRSPKYASSWHLTNITSLITNESVDLVYEKKEVNYNSNKSLIHSFPNFSTDGVLLKTSSNTNLSGIAHQVLKTEWQSGKASLIYNLTETFLSKNKIKQITGQRGELMEFKYTVPRPDIVGDNLLSEVDLYIGGSLSKGWILNYGQNTSLEVPVCNEEEENSVFEMPEEFVLEFDDIIQKHDFPTKRTKSIIIGFLFHDDTFHHPITYINPFMFSKYLSSKDQMTEFGSIMLVKSLEKYYGAHGSDFTYFNEINKFNAEKGRAFLESVQEKGRGGEVYDLVSFDYYGETENLPKRFSPHQDLWGYYNDNSASLSLLPRMKYTDVYGGTQEIPELGGSSLALHFGFSIPEADISIGHNEDANLERCLIGALKEVENFAGGKSIFSYELNSWPTGDGDQTLGGAGLRVKQIVENPGDDFLSKVTSYSYLEPTIINRPIRISNNVQNITTHGIESMVITSSSPLNEWVKNKNHYVGYGKVKEAINQAGKITHYFTTPRTSVEYEPVVPLVNNLRLTFNALSGFDVESIALDLPNIDEPYPKVISKDWRYGLEILTEVADGSGALVQETRNHFTFDYPDKENSNTPNISGVQVEMYQQNYPGPLEDNIGLGELFYFIPDSFLPSTVNRIIGLIQSISSFVHPFRRINKNFFYSSYKYEFEQVKLSQTIKKEFFSNDSQSGNTTVTTDIYYDEKEGVNGGFFFRVSGTSVDYGNTEEASEVYFYSDASPVLLRTEQGVLDNLEQIGFVGYNKPLRVDSYENGVLTSGSFSELVQNGGRYVPLSNWSVRNGEYSLINVIKGWDSNGMPKEIEIAKYNPAVDFDLELGDFEFVEEPIILTWDDNLLLRSKKFGIFSETYNYTSFNEYSGKTDINGVADVVTYDNRGWVESQKLRNGREQTIYSYLYRPLTISSTTTLSGLGSISGVKVHDGFGHVISSEMGPDNDEFLYDANFNLVAQDNNTTGETTFTYEPSPISRLTGQTDAVGNSTLYQYAGTNGNVFSSQTVTNANGNSSMDEYDAFGRILKHTSGEGGQTGYQYDNLGRLSTVTNPIGESYVYTYNDFGAISSKSFPGGYSYKYTYNDIFQNVAVTNNQGKQFIYDKDIYGRVHDTYLYNNQPLSNLEIWSTQQVQNQFSGGNLVHHNDFEANTTFVTGFKEHVFESSGFQWLEVTHGALDDLGQPLQSDASYPDGYGVKSTMTYDAFGNVISNGQLISLNNNDLVYTTISDDFDQYTRNSGYNGAISGVAGSGDPNESFNFKTFNSYHGDRNLMVKSLIGLDGEGNALQSVDYYYDDIGRIILINAPYTASCTADFEFCTFSERLIFKSSEPECRVLEKINVNGEEYVLEEPVDLYYPQTVSLADHINAALDHYGYTGEATQITGRVQDGIREIVIEVSNTTVTGVLLYFQDCNEPISLSKEDCCEEDDTVNPVTGSGYSFNDDLFYERLEYGGLNIVFQEMSTDCANGSLKYHFEYDQDHRLTYRNNSSLDAPLDAGPYSTEYEYDPAGNIKRLKRNGLIALNTTGSTFGLIDDLEYIYSNGNSILSTVLDHTVDPDAQLKGYKYKEVDYTFSNGNFSSSIDVGGQLVHGISYYPNNQPRSISVQGGGESYSYTLSGMKFKQERQELVDGQIETEERYYIGGVEFVDGVMQTFYFPDGRIVLDKGSKEIFAQYKIKDHLGNTAVVFQDKNLDDVVIDEEAADAFNLELEVLQRDFYYPFGLSMEGAWIAGSTDDPRMDYRYNGKELSQVTGLMAYGARYYDPAIARWNAVDPLAEKFSKESPYNYVGNDPIRNIDIGGNYKLPVEFIQKYPNFARYLQNSVQSDVMSSRLILQGLFNNTAADSSNGIGNLTKSEVEKTTKWNSGPTIVIVDSPGGLSGAHGYYDNSNSQIQLATGDIEALESILASEGSSEEKLQALTKTYMTLLHETVHYGDYLDGLRQDGGEPGVDFEIDVWGIKGENSDGSTFSVLRFFPDKYSDNEALENMVREYQNKGQTDLLPSLPKNK